MASITYLIRSQQDKLTPIYIRVVDGRQKDIAARTGLVIHPKHWDSKAKKIRNIADFNERETINSALTKLSIHVSEQYNLAYINGEIVDKMWIERTICQHFNRPETSISGRADKTRIYFTDYAQNWLDTKAKTFRISKGGYMGEKSIRQYQQVIDNFREFEGTEKVMFRELNNELLDQFSTCLSEDLQYAEKTVKRKIVRVKFFCSRAESENINVSKSYRERVFVKEDDCQYKEPYFNESEIDKIFKFDLSFDKELDNVRDNLLIGLWTGLRISDYLTRLDISNFDNGFINIRTMKTKTYVQIPIHKHIAHVLSKRNGNLPDKISEQTFNLRIKVLARLMEFDNEMMGGVVKVDDSGVKRKQFGVYKKWELITSHIGRRSLATNLFGKVSNKVIMEICGWKSERQLLAYNKQSSRESAEILKTYWETKN